MEMEKEVIMHSKKERQELLSEVMHRKEKYISQNKQYRKWEHLYHRHSTGKYIGDFIYGANDGLITTFAVVAGSVGASLSPIVIIILGFANILADGISMAASNYLSLKSEQDYAKAQRAKENWEVENLRPIEVDEIREIFEKKGFRGNDLKKAVEIITSDKKVWVDTMMKDELGIIEDERDDPKMHGVATFTAFVFAGVIPLFAYIIPGVSSPFEVSIIAGLVMLFLVGALRSLVTVVSWFRGGLEVLAIGSTAAFVAFLVGSGIEKLVR